MSDPKGDPSTLAGRFASDIEGSGGGGGGDNLVQTIDLMNQVDSFDSGGGGTIFTNEKFASFETTRLGPAESAFAQVTVEGEAGDEVYGIQLLAQGVGDNVTLFSRSGDSSGDKTVFRKSFPPGTIETGQAYEVGIDLITPSASQGNEVTVYGAELILE